MLSLIAMILPTLIPEALAIDSAFSLALVMANSLAWALKSSGSSMLKSGPLKLLTPLSTTPLVMALIFIKSRIFKEMVFLTVYPTSFGPGQTV